MIVSIIHQPSDRANRKLPVLNRDLVGLIDVIASFYRA